MDAVAKGVAGTIAVLAVLAIGFFAYPAALLGTDADGLAGSVNESVGTRVVFPSDWISCRPGDAAEWRCGRYHVDADWRGCWKATPLGGTEVTLTGCIGVLDALGLNNPVGPS